MEGKKKREGGARERVKKKERKKKKRGGGKEKETTRRKISRCSEPPRGARWHVSDGPRSTSDIHTPNRKRKP